jgi:hemolysin III
MNKKDSINNFTSSEEIWHSATHGLGFLLGVAALVLLMSFACIDHKSTTVFASLVIYGSSLIVMYGSSTIYHALKNSRAKEIFQRLDHSSIYILIAGTYTPITLVVVGGREGWIVFATEWTVALLGIALKFVYPKRFELFSLIAYLLMGWLIVVVFETFMENIEPIGFWLVCAGGAAYTMGVIFYIKDNITYFHTIWHIFVLTGSILHFFAIILYIA